MSDSNKAREFWLRRYGVDPIDTTRIGQDDLVRTLEGLVHGEPFLSAGWLRTRYEFDDGSAVVQFEDAWDYGRTRKELGIGPNEHHDGLFDLPSHDLPYSWEIDNAGKWR